jgi:hypothetical protein
MVEMIYQCATPPITQVIKHLQYIKKKYGNIPVANHNGIGLHISVERSNRPSQDLPIYVKRIKISNGVTKVINKPNPDSKYVWFW